MSTHRLKYPFSWSKDRVNAFVEKYARGTYFLSTIVGTTPGHCRFLLALVLARGNSLKWEVMKRVIKILETYKREDLARLTPEEQKLLLKCLRTLAEDDEIDSKEGAQVLDTLNQSFLSL